MNINKGKGILVDKFFMVKKYTLEGIPVLKKGILETFIRDMSVRKEEGTIKDYHNEIVERIKKSNPLYLDYCDSLGKCYAYKTKEEIVALLVGLIIGYETLRRQGESNKLEESQNSEQQKDL